MIYMFMKIFWFFWIELRIDKNENGFVEYSDVKVNGLVNKYCFWMVFLNGY